MDEQQQSTTEVPASNSKQSFKLERYKFILQQLNNLNENSYKYLMLYQTLGTAVVGGCVILFVSWKELKIEAYVAIAGVRAAMILLVTLTVCVIFLIIVNVWSWLDFRREEVELVNESMGEEFRKSPTLKNAWRWHETYIIVFLISVAVAVVLLVEYRLVPLIQ